MVAPTAFPKVYTVNGPSSTSSPSLPTWLTTKTRPTKTAKKRQKTQHTLGQLELIQDFAFPESAIKIKTTPDGLHAIGTGAYKPMMKVWDLEQLTVKFERVTDAENVDFAILSNDWTKTLHLQRDRSLSLHTQGGLHYSLRLPRYGRALAYHSPSCDALVGCTGTEVYRLNLEQGRFMAPLNIADSTNAESTSVDVTGVNCLDVNPRHGLWSMGLEGGGGVVEFWDPRSRTSLTRLSLPAKALLPTQSYTGTSLYAPNPLGVSALKSHPTDGLSLAVGTTSGHTLLYDLRSPKAFAVKDQGYGEPVKVVDWLRGGGPQEDLGRVVSADSKVVKVWGKEDPSTNHLSLHPTAPLVDLHPVPETGLIMVACDAAPLSSYYVPEIGPAPKWASFLDNVTEELADDPDAGASKGAYSDFKFVDRKELDTLGLTHLVGTSTLKPYMHGYFVSLKLYAAARLIANPQSYTEHREKIVNEKLAAQHESRIRAKREQPKVNKALAERVRKTEEKEKDRARQKRERLGEEAAAEEDGVPEGTILEDPRFKELWENPDFEVDEDSREFGMLNPATARDAAAKRKTAVEEEEEESDSASSDGLGASEESDEESDDGDLRQYDPRNFAPSERPSQGNSLARIGSKQRERPKLVSGAADDDRPRPSSTFGQRLSSSQRASGSKGKDGKPEGVLSMRKQADGGMEMSFIPTGPAGDHEDGRDFDGAESEVREPRRRKPETFGAGLEKGGDEPENDVEGEAKMGRTKRRHPGRSASKNVFRQR